MTRCISDPDPRLSAFATTIGAAPGREALRVLRAAETAAREAGYPSLAATALDSGALSRWWSGACRRWNSRTHEQYFYRLRGYFEWLYEQGAVVAFSLRSVQGSEVARDGWVSLRLSRPLQRDIDAHVASLGSHSSGHRRLVRRVLLDFERFWNHRGGRLGRATMIAWLRHRLRRYRDRAEGFCLGILRRFLRAYPVHCDGGPNPAALASGIFAIRLTASLRAGRRIGLAPPAPPRTQLTAHWKKFVRLKRRLGSRYVNEPRLFGALDRFLCARGWERLGDLTPAAIGEFLRTASLRRARSVENKRDRLRSFFGFLVARGILASDPTRTIRPGGLPSAMPYVYSHKQIEGLLHAARELPGQTERGLQIYTLFHLVYACGLRAGEARRLQLGDVDLDRRLLLIRKTKFFKDRLVPFNARVEENLRRLLRWRFDRYPSASPTDAFFVSGHHAGFSYGHLRDIFQRLREAAGIRPSIPGQRACIHALRRTFAVHRLLRWYRQTEDVNAKLPLLATYMGHAGWEYTRVYLTMTPALMKTAGRRFAGDFERALDETA